MSDIKLSRSGQTRDLFLGGHGLNVVDGEEAIDQQITIRLRTFLAEWFLDERVGIPYFRHILVKNPNIPLVHNVFRKTILSTPGVASVDSLNLDIDTVARTLTVTFSATLDTGSTLTYSPFILEL